VRGGASTGYTCRPGEALLHGVANDKLARPLFDHLKIKAVLAAVPDDHTEVVSAKNMHRREHRKRK
jgi:hypothetical protein